jgi:hypothetical protein
MICLNDSLKAKQFGSGDFSFFEKVPDEIINGKNH